MSELRKWVWRTPDNVCPIAVGRKAWNHVRRVVVRIMAPFVFHLAARRCASIDQAVELASTFRFGHLKVELWQVHSEIVSLLELLDADPPGTVLEIGTCKGGSLFLLTRVATPDALLMSIDLRAGRFGGGYAPDQSVLYRSFARKRQRVELLVGDSHDASMLDEVRQRLLGRQLDLLFIDGDHTREGVSRDFAMYSPLIRPGGLVAFHDIVPGPGELVGGVPQFWAELKSRAVAEYVESWNQGGFGIGALRMEGRRSRAGAAPAEIDGS